MTGPERKRARELDILLAAGEIRWWGREPWSLRLAKGLHYVPDFVVVDADMTIVCEEVKGTRGWDLDSTGRVKFKAASIAFPWLRFVSLLQMRKSAGGGWQRDEVAP